MKAYEKTDRSNELLNLLLQLPTDFAKIEEELKTGKYDETAVTRAAYDYAEGCWWDDGIDEINIPQSKFYEEAALIPGLHSTNLPQVFALLAKYGLEPNALVDGYSLMDAVWNHVFNGYVAADTLKILFEHGANPYIVNEFGESFFKDLEFDAFFDAVEQEIRSRYDAIVHAFLVTVAFADNRRKDGSAILTIFDNTNCTTVPFQIEDLKEHRNYYYGVTHEKKDLLLRIFDKRTRWEVARY